MEVGVVPLVLRENGHALQKSGAALEILKVGEWRRMNDEEQNGQHVPNRRKMRA
jgi:hypothetical protein